MKEPDWTFAACRHFPVDWWFPERGGDAERAKAICQTCPIKTECFDYAVSSHQMHGIWGGKSIGRWLKHGGRIPSQDRRILTLLTERDMTGAELAEVLELHPGTVQQRMVRLVEREFVETRNRRRRAKGKPAHIYKITPYGRERLEIL